MGLWILSAKGSKSVVSGEEPAKQQAPATATETKQEAPAPSPVKEEGAVAQELETTDKKAEAKKDETPPKKDLH